MQYERSECVFWIFDEPNFILRVTSGVVPISPDHSGQPPYKRTPHGEQHSSIPCFPIGCWLPMDCAWVNGGNWSMSHSACHSGLQQTCSALDTLWNFQGATMAPLCSRTSPVGPVSKRRSWFSWANHCYGWNLGSLIWTKLEMPIKQMEASWFSSSKVSAPYTMCCEGHVHCVFSNAN